MKFFGITLIICLAFVQSAAQKLDTVKTVYEKLQVLKYYAVTTSTANLNNKVSYKANGKEIKKEKYNEMVESKSSMDKCTPCVLETYDENDKLIIKAVQYKDCCVGYWVRFYPNGKVRTFGHYRENDSGSWDPLWDNGYCIKHGSWTEYDLKGKPVKTEMYNFGSLKE